MPRRILICIYIYIHACMRGTILLQGSVGFGSHRSLRFEFLDLSGFG